MLTVVFIFSSIHSADYIATQTVITHSQYFFYKNSILTIHISYILRTTFRYTSICMYLQCNLDKYIGYKQIVSYYKNFIKIIRCGYTNKVHSHTFRMSVKMFIHKNNYIMEYVGISFQFYLRIRNCLRMMLPPECFPCSNVWQNFTICYHSSSP